MAYSLQGSAPPLEGSIRAPISVAVSSAYIQESAIRYLQTDLVIPLSMFRLWRGFWSKAGRLLINPMEYCDIQMGRGGGFILEG